jgi:hypothetical protein
MGLAAFDWCQTQFNLENHAAIIQTVYSNIKGVS